MYTSDHKPTFGSEEQEIDLTSYLTQFWRKGCVCSFASLFVCAGGDEALQDFCIYEKIPIFRVE
jgi:hypothetical protein